MYVKSVVIKNKTGLHARPAAEFVGCAKRYSSDIRVRRPGEAEGVSAKSMMRVLSKCLSQGVTVEISAHGEDEEQAVEALAALVHPEKGVTLTPYSTVEPSCDRNLLPAQLVLLPEDDIPYVWGIEDGTGAPIELTGREYFERYVFNADYTAAPETAVDTVLMQGNALENVASAYPEGRFVEYHFPGLDEQMAGYDWCSLKLVFECYQGDWYLVGLVHSEWTV